VTFVPVICPPKQFCSLCRFSIMLSFRARKIIFTRTRTQEIFPGFVLCFCNLLFETNNFVLGVALLWCFVFEYRNRPHRDLNSGHFTGIFTSLYSLPGIKE
jgi:hypothetical protein